MNAIPDRPTGFLAAVVVGGFALAIGAMALVEDPGLIGEPDSIVTAAAPSAQPRTSGQTSGDDNRFVSAEGGFAIDLPRDWRVESETGGRYVFSQVGGLGSMGVRVGTGAEPATMCVGSSPCTWSLTRIAELCGQDHSQWGATCPVFRSATSLAQLLGIVHEGDQRAPSAEPETLRFGTDEAWRVTSHYDLLEGRERYVNTYVLVIHNRQPFILGFVESSLHQGPDGWIDDMLQRFLFLGEGLAASEWPTFTSAEAGFVIDVPQGWAEEPDEDPDAVWIHGSEGGLKIRVGDGSGNILNCNVPPSSPCVEAQIESVEDLVELLTPTGRRSPPFVPGSVWLSRKASSLGNIPAVQMTVRTWESGPLGQAYTRHYVVAVDNGRPIIIKWEPGTFKGREFHQLLASFRFLD